MQKEIVNPDGLPDPRGYNHAIAVDGGRLLFLAGQDAADPDGEIVSDDMVEQFEQVLRNLQTVVHEAGGEMSNIMKLNVFVDDRDEYEAQLEPLGEVFSEYFEGHYPTMALFEVSGFYREANRVELEGFAVLDD
jgi:enamine deaminase RidA (YjgF/YER057c/UK114 family)